MKRTLLGAVAALALSSSLAVADYPEREVLGVVMWGAGGATDTVARAVNPAAEEALGKPIVVLNKSGGAGAISTAASCSRTIKRKSAPVITVGALKAAPAKRLAEAWNKLSSPVRRANCLG
mgnify:CR=1 FL=1